MRTHQQPLADSPTGCPRLTKAMAQAGVTTLMSVPLVVNKTFLGVLSVWNKEAGQAFTADDQQLLAILASEAVQLIERMRLYKAEREWLRLSREILLAREIHSRLLPAEAPIVPGYNMVGTSRPARAVGGDFFDFLPRAGDRLAVWLGDVVGKGLPAGLCQLDRGPRTASLCGTPPGSRGAYR